VIAARNIQAKRFKGKSATNSAMGPRQVKTHGQLHSTASSYLEQAMEQLNFAARAHERILKSHAPSPILQAPNPSAPMTSSKPSSSARWIGSCLRDDA